MATPRKAVEAFRERAELLDFLLEVSRITSETLDLDQLLANVADIVKVVVPYDLFAILLYSERNQGLRIRYSIGHREEIVRSMVIGLGEGIVGTAGQTREPILVEDVRTDPRYLVALDAVQSELAVPMMAHGKLVGVIDVQSTRLRAFHDQDRRIMRLIASRVAGSIENASLYRRVNQQNRTFRTLAQLSQEFSSILDLDELLGKLAASVRTLMKYDAFSILLVDADKKVLRHRFSVRYDQRVDLDNISLGMGITGAAAESRQTVRVVNTLQDPRYIASQPDIHSEMAVPLIVQDRVVGVLNLESERIGNFTEEHQRTLSLLAPQIASSVENARLYEELAGREQRMDQDLKAARKLQKVLLPREADIRGLDIAIRSRAAREISGDVYEFFEQGDDYAVIAFGDVSGKGAAAALYGALISGLLRILTPRRRSPAMLMQSLNEALLERKIDAVYATLMVLLWEPRTHRMTISNAGAEPLLISRGGQIITAKAEGMPIGLLEHQTYDEVTYQAESGDTLLLFSDGVEDQLNSNEEHFGRPRVQRLLTKHDAETPRAVVDQIFAELDEFRETVALTDDQTVVTMKGDRMNAFTYGEHALYCEGVALAEIAARVGTPCYVYSAAAILENFRAYDETFGDQPHTICYAMKANSNLAILSLLAHAGAGFDIVSGGELFRVIKAGGDPAKVVFSGVGKTAPEIDDALQAGIFNFNCESEPELALIDALAHRRGGKARVALRVNPDVETDTHHYISTGKLAHKFGVDIAQAEDIYERARQYENLLLEGVSCHIGSLLLDAKPLMEAVDRVLALIERLRAKGFNIRHADLGGGLGVAYKPDEVTPSIAEFVKCLKQRVAGRDLHVVLEPGRSIVAAAGVLLTKTLYRKQTGEKEFVIVDAAMNDLIRPALYSAHHEILPVRQNTSRKIRADVVGPVCETGDFLARDRELPEVLPGDVLAISTAGAYGFVQSSTYNARRRPAEVLVEGAAWRIVRERESYDDLIRGETI